MYISNGTLLLTLCVILAGCSGSNNNPTPSNDSETEAANNSLVGSNDSLEVPGRENGESGVPTVVVPDQVNSDVLSTENAQAVILQAFDVLTGRAYDWRLMGFPYLTFDETNDQTSVRSRECQNQGSISETTSTSGQHLLTSVYSDCTINSDTLTGQVVTKGGNFCCEFEREFSVDFSVTFQPNGIMEASGNYVFRNSIAFQRSVSFSNFTYRFMYPNGELLIENANTDRDFNVTGYGITDDQSSVMSGSFSMSPGMLDGASVSVNVVSDFENTDHVSQLTYERGFMQIVAEDSQITVDANTGDRNTVTVSVTNSLGEVETSTGDWSSWHDALAYQTPTIQQQSPTLLPASDGRLIRGDSYKPLLKEVFDLLTGERVGPEILDMPDYPTPEFPNGFLSQNAPNGFGEPVFQDCSNGGSVVQTPYKRGIRQIISGWRSEFTDCQSSDKQYNGEFHTRNFGNFNYTGSGFSVVSQDETAMFTGSLSYKHQVDIDGGPSVHVSLDADHYQSLKLDDSIELFDATTNYTYIPPFSSNLHGNLTYRSQLTEDQLISVSIADPLIVGPSRTQVIDFSIFNYFRSGLLVIDAGSGNTLWLDADTGDIETFSITIYQTGAAPFMAVESWSDWEAEISFKYDLHTR